MLIFCILVNEEYLKVLVFHILLLKVLQKFDDMDYTLYFKSFTISFGLQVNLFKTMYLPWFRLYFATVYVHPSRKPTNRTVEIHDTNLMLIRPLSFDNRADS